MWNLAGGGAKSSIPSQSYLNNSIANASGVTGPGTYLNDAYHGSYYDPVDRIHVLEPTVVTADREYSVGWTGADADDAGSFGSNDDAYVMDEARTRFQRDEGAKTARIVNGQIAEAKMMADARDAQKSTVQNQFELNPTASLVEKNTQALGSNLAVNTGNALHVSEAGAAFGNRQLSIRERTQTNDPGWSSNVGRGYRGEPLSVMATHDEREAAKLGGLLRFGVDLT